MRSFSITFSDLCSWSLNFFSDIFRFIPAQSKGLIDQSDWREEEGYILINFNILSATHFSKGCSAHLRLFNFTDSYWLMQLQQSHSVKTRGGSTDIKDCPTLQTNLQGMVTQLKSFSCEALKK